MSIQDIIGRETEIKRLDQCMRENKAQLIIVYGRRRIGKTYLINSYFENQFDFKLTGIFNQPIAIQLDNFARELRRQTGKTKGTPNNWFDAFDELRTYLEELEKEPVANTIPGSMAKRKLTVFFDEMPWLDTRGSNFISAFEWFWNDYGCTNKNLVFIVCGSAASWMSEKIDKNKGGLFSRQTCRLYLKPFTLYETERFLMSKQIEWSRYDIAECYMIMGGIPYYLDILNSGLYYSANIDNLFFRKSGELWDEFDHLYHTLFSNSKQYIKIVETLSRRRYGMTRKEISDATGLAYNGVLSTYLSNLEASGFIRVFSKFNCKKRDLCYQLTDYYTLFYFRFIKDNYGADEHFWSHSYDYPARRTWAGLTFELLSWDHVSQIKKKLGIFGVLTKESTWNFIKSKKTDETIFSDHKTVSDNDTIEEFTGAQIDLLIDRRDRTINVCEIMFSTKEFEIDEQYNKSLRNKVESFRQATDTKKTLSITMITTYGVKPGKYTGAIGSEVVLDDLFEK
ncbi:MAG: ATP-binding protein [Lachnospiraceae bacterium]|nr:ATP-binding protein [Lachnospiraceae bacterium]